MTSDVTMKTSGDPRRMTWLLMLLVFLQVITLDIADAQPDLAKANTVPESGSGRDDRAARWVAGTQLAPPFVTRGDDGRYAGVAIELWREVARGLGVETEFRAFDYDRAGLIRALEEGEVDIAVSNLAVSENLEQRVDFTHPFLSSELAIVTGAETDLGWIATLRSIRLGQAVLAIAALLLALSLAGAAIWAIERRRNPEQFDPRFAPGVLDGLWWAAVTMTTTGYGDKTPRSFPGRLVAIVWMFSSLFLTALFSATLASSLVVDGLRSRVTGPQDLPRVRVAAVDDGPGRNWLVRHGIAIHAYPFVIQALNAVQRGDVDALVYDRIILRHLLRVHPARGLLLLPQGLAEVDYAFAVREGSARREVVNRAMLRATDEQSWAVTTRMALGRSP